MLFLFWLACTDSATLCAFVYFEWSPCTKNPPVPLKNDARGTPGKSPVLNTDRAYKYRGWVAQTLEIKNTASILLVDVLRRLGLRPLCHWRMTGPLIIYFISYCSPNICAVNIIRKILATLTPNENICPKYENTPSLVLRWFICIFCYE